MNPRKSKSEILINENNRRRKSYGKQQRQELKTRKENEDPSNEKDERICKENENRKESKHRSNHYCEPIYGPTRNKKGLDERSYHSTLTSIYSENSLIRNDIVKRYDKLMDRTGSIARRTKSICGDGNISRNQRSSIRDDQSLCSYSSLRSTDNRSLYSVHSARSVFERALVNYKFIIGNNYPLSKVLAIWKSLNTYIENQLKQNKSIIIPKLGIFTLNKTYLQQFIHNKPILIVNKSLTRIHGLIRKEYSKDKSMKKQMINYREISNLCHTNAFIVEEIIQEIIKSFEKLIMTNQNCELPFFNIGKLQIENKRIRMKFYEDFIKSLNSNLYNRSNSNLSLNTNLCKLSRTSSILSKQTTTHWKSYKPSLEFSSVLPIGDGSSGDSIRQRSISKINLKRSRSTCSRGITI